MILFLHNRYRTTGGEERAVENLLWLVREHLGEEAELLSRDSTGLGRGRAAQRLLAGGERPDDVERAVRATGARIVHAHNLLPRFGWRSLAAARSAGAMTVLHLHNYRLVCAVGTCIDSRGEDCVRCQGRNTAPGVALRCRGGIGEAAVYGTALALWQRRLVEHADVIVVPSDSARRRLEALSAPLGSRVFTLPIPLRRFAERSAAAAGDYAVVASRLAREKDVATAIAAARIAQIPLVVAGDGPLEPELRELAQGSATTFAGRLDEADLDAIRARARVALVPSRAHETFGLAALEAMAQGVPVVAARAGALGELEGDAALVDPGDAAAMAAAITSLQQDPGAGERALAAAHRRADPAVAAERLSAAYSAS